MSKFLMAAETSRVPFELGWLRWISDPTLTKSKQLTVVEAEFLPGKGHGFHKHPDQEEVIICVSGTMEQWLGKEKRLLGPGDSVHVDAGEVHATFNDGDESVRFIAILGPCVGDAGYEQIDVSGEEPWASLR